MRQAGEFRRDAKRCMAIAPKASAAATGTGGIAAIMGRREFLAAMRSMRHGARLVLARPQ